MTTLSAITSIKEYKQTEKKIKIQKTKEYTHLQKIKKDRERIKDQELSHYRCSYFQRVFFRSGPYYIKGEQSQRFHRKYYELPIETLTHVNGDNMGFTNQVLMQELDKETQIYVPAYVSLKVKNIQQLKFKDLEANIHCVLLIVFYLEELPNQIKEHLKSKVMVQINRGNSFFLNEEEGKTNIKFKEAGKNKEYFTFTIRWSFPVQIYEDIFWSPFEVLRLVLSVTINSVSIPKMKIPADQSKPSEGLNKKRQKNEGNRFVYDPSKSYQVSFNCMRNPQKITVSYITGCRLGVYDLAQNLLQGYPSNLATYDQIKQKFFEFVAGYKKFEAEQDDISVNEFDSCLQTNIRAPVRAGKQLHPEMQVATKDKEGKIKYYQYCHFVIPMYKYPGNALATIFIPVFMLALLSLSIFFQGKNAADQKIGSIATFVLGFIALIPSIKDELPPSQELTFSEIVVYSQAINCMLSLVSHWFTDSHNVWRNPIFLISLLIHIFCFTSALILFYLHKIWWQPMYNRRTRIQEINPVSNHRRWHNPYCDNLFLNQNYKIMQKKGKGLVVSAFPKQEKENKTILSQRKEEGRNQIRQKVQMASSVSVFANTTPKQIESPYRKNKMSSCASITESVSY